MSVPTKSRNPTICGWGDSFQSYLTPFLRVLSISGFLKVIHAPKTPKRGFLQVPRKLTSSIAFFKSLQSGLPINLINTPMSRVSCPKEENPEKKNFEKKNFFWFIFWIFFFFKIFFLRIFFIWTNNSWHGGVYKVYGKSRLQGFKNAMEEVNFWSTWFTPLLGFFSSTPKINFLHSVF